MNLSAQQLQALGKLIESSEDMVELYWDTDNGQKLSRSLEAVRAAFAGLGRSKFDAVNERESRLIIEAQCSICGPLDEQYTGGLSTVRLAMGHSSVTGHIVILNGTADLPEGEESPSTPGALPGDSTESAAT